MAEKENIPGKINNPHKCGRIMIVLDQHKIPKEGLLIDRKNKQFALADCQMLALFPNGMDRIKATKKELKSEVQSLLKDGWTEAELSYYKSAQLDSGWIKKGIETMGSEFENRKGKIVRLDECGEILRTRNQFNFSEEALAIDHRNSQFAVFNGMARSKGVDEKSKWTTHKEVRERLRFLIKQGYTEADMGYGQADYRLYLPEFKKELAAEIKAKATSARREIDIKKTLENAKNNGAEKSAQKKNNSGYEMERKRKELVMSKTIETPKAWIPDENRVLRISNDMDVLINFNQYNETRGGLIIDHKNQQFALWAGQGMGPDTGHAERTTMKKIVERANELRRRGYAEGVVSNEFARTSLFRHQPRHEQEKIVEMHAWLEMNSKEKPAPHFMKRQGFGGPVKDDEKRDSIAAAKSVLKRLGDAGIEVSWNREEFQRVLETSEKLNKMVRKLDDFEEKRKELDVLHNEKDEIEKEIETAEKARKEAEKETYNEDFVDFKRTLLLLKDFIDKDILEKIKQETGLKIKKTAKGDIILDLNEFETYMVEMDKDKWGMDYEEDGEDMFDVFKEPCSSAVMKLETMKETISKNFLSKKIEDIIYGSLVEKINRARKDMEKDIDTVFINKNVGTLTAKESYELKEKLLKLPYVEINGIKLYANKIDEAVEKENFLGELGISSILENHGYEVFILPEQYTENNSHADGLAKKEGEENFEFIDLKNLSAKNLRTVGERFRHGKEQGRNVLIYLQEDFSNQELVKEINWEIKNKLPAESINGVLIVMFEKSNQYIEYAIKKDGIQPITKDSVRPSARAGVAEATTPLKNSVSQEDSLVNRTHCLT